MAGSSRSPWQKPWQGVAVAAKSGANLMTVSVAVYGSDEGTCATLPLSVWQ